MSKKSIGASSRRLIEVNKALDLKILSNTHDLFLELLGAIADLKVIESSKERQKLAEARKKHWIKKLNAAYYQN